MAVAVAACRGQEGQALSLAAPPPRGLQRGRPAQTAPRAGPHLLHEHLHVVGATPAVGLHDEAEAQGHGRHVHLGAGGTDGRTDG